MLTKAYEFFCRTPDTVSLFFSHFYICEIEFWQWSYANLRAALLCSTSPPPFFSIVLHYSSTAVPLYLSSLSLFLYISVHASSTEREIEIQFLFSEMTFPREREAMWKGIYEYYIYYVVAVRKGVLLYYIAIFHFWEQWTRLHVFKWTKQVLFVSYLRDFLLRYQIKVFVKICSSNVRRQKSDCELNGDS